MALIPGAIPVTGFIGPTDDSDVYAVTDALYGIDGLRNVPNYATRNAITFERRRVGMIVGTQNDLKYWKLLPPSPGPDWNYDDTDWSLAFDLAVGPVGDGGLKYRVASGENIVVSDRQEYLIYGDLIIDAGATFTVQAGGKLVILNGTLTNNGTFDNFGTLQIVDLLTGANKWIQAVNLVAGVPSIVNHNLNSLDLLWKVREGNDDVNVEVTRVDLNNLSVLSNVTMSGNIIISK